MRVYLMRHASAEDPGGVPDALRRLTEQGSREAREAGEALRERGATVSVILTSPRVRARETAELVAAAIGAPVQVRETLSCGATGEVFLAELRSVESGGVLLVAHNPELSAFSSELLGQSISFRPSTLVEVEMDGPTLEWLRHPNP